MFQTNLRNVCLSVIISFACRHISTVTKSSMLKVHLVNEYLITRNSKFIIYEFYLVFNHTIHTVTLFIVKKPLIKITIHLPNLCKYKLIAYIFSPNVKWVMAQSMPRLNY